MKNIKLMLSSKINQTIQKREIMNYKPDEQDDFFDDFKEKTENIQSTFNKNRGPISKIISTENLILFKSEVGNMNLFRSCYRFFRRILQENKYYSIREGFKNPSLKKY